MLIDIVGVLHLSISLVISFYPFIFKKSWFDYLFIISTLIITLSWTFYNGECLLTYYFKLKDDPNYIAGTNSTDVTDMYKNIPDPRLADFILVTKFLAHIISEFIVFSRNKFPKLVCYLVPFIHVIYTGSLYFFTNIPENEVFLAFQEVIKVVLLIIIVYTLKRIF